MDDAAAQSEKRIRGLSVSYGIGIGNVAFYQDESRPIQRTKIRSNDVKSEIERFRLAVQESVAELSDLVAGKDTDPAEPINDIFSLQLLILEQSSFAANVEALITNEHLNSEWALKSVSDESILKQSAVTDPHLSEKRLDIEDVRDRLHSALKGDKNDSSISYDGKVVFASELKPSAMLELSKNKPAAVITERGGWTSHASILARELRMPMVSGIRNLSNFASEGTEVIVDGDSGTIIIGAARNTLETYSSRLKTSSYQEELPALPASSRTVDGHQVIIRANVDIPEAYEQARRFGAEGIGLFRSESLISRPGRIPSEDAQVKAYREIADVAGDAGVRIRTFDINIDRLNGNEAQTEANPSLGLRSIRLSLDEQVHFRIQIRAILRAASDRKIDILLPMVSGVSEILRAKEVIDDEISKLKSAGIAIGEPRLGAMIEVPSGVLMASEIVRMVDFVALGTNDLVQYLLAVDRDNDSVAEWYQTLHPAVIRAIGTVLSAGAAADKKVIICGEMAGSPFYAPVLIGLGARELSMNINSIRQIRRLVSSITLEQTESLIRKISLCETSDETESTLRSFYADHWSDIFPSGSIALNTANQIKN